jgi:hypothetical protein
MTPTEPPCWPNDPDYLDGRVRLDIPSERLLHAYWDADLLDRTGNDLEQAIISIKEDFVVRFRVELVGRLWLCMAGRWCFDLGFAPIGAGTGFNLRDKLPGRFDYNDWKGCATRCVELAVTVPAGTVGAGECGTLYEVGARAQLHCCDHKLSVVAAFEPKEEYEFFDPDA